MDTLIKVKQEVPSELTSQNEIGSIRYDLPLKKNNDDNEWNEDCKMEIKTEMKQEAPVTDCFSRDERQLFTKDPAKNLKIDTYSNVMELDAKVDTASDVYSENERECFPKDRNIRVKECSSDEVEIKEEPWWLERTTQDPTGCEQIKNERNASELPRLNTQVVPQVPTSTHVGPFGKDISLNPKPDSSELIGTRKTDSNTRETFSIEESLCSDDYAQHNGIVTIDLIQQNSSYDSDSNKVITCKPHLVYKQEACHKSFNHLSNLKQHNSYHDDINIHEWQDSMKTSTQMSELKQRDLIHKGVKPYKCEMCKKSFTKLSYLKQHIPIHEGVRAHKCEICGKTFTQLSSLKRHNLIHDGVKPYKCEKCEKSFSLLPSFKEHKRIHEGLQPHKCQKCEKTFIHLSSLKQHNLIHKGVKLHKCKICDRAFTYLSRLKQHDLIHKGVKHKCKICEKTFIHLSNLKQHSLIHEGVNLHKCDVCEKTFNRLSNYKQHSLIHEDVKSHKCEICGKTFRQMSALKRHVLVHEKKKFIQKR